MLALLPFWDAQIPPMGISSLKAFLGKHGYSARTVDANLVPEFGEINDKYFAALEEATPPEKRGNFHNVGQDVLRNHLMAYIHRKEEQPTAYFDLVKELVLQTFYFAIDEARVQLLHSIVENFYARLKSYFLDLLAREQPTILGLSVYRGNIAPSMFAFNLARINYPHIKTVMGGAVFAGELAQGSENLQYFLERTPYIDTLIAGEGENLFLKYLQGELPPGQRLFTLADIDGETLDISTAPRPDFSDLDLEFYPALAVYASRSCPYNCSFCTETVYWGKYRKKQISQVVAEMTALFEKYRSQLFLLCDSLLNPIVTGLARGLSDTGLSLYWDGYLRASPEACTLDNTMLWRRGGFYRARLGIESGSPHVLEMMGKQITIDQIKATISNLAAAGIKTTTYWVTGHPGETEEDFRQTLAILEELRDDIYEAWCCPFNYYKTGQVGSHQWEESSRLLYPGRAKELLVVQAWTLDLAPTREEAYRRMNRFTALLRELAIPNPYTIVDFHHADERWAKLHKNAVPHLVRFKDKDSYIDENRRVKPVLQAQAVLNSDMEFNF